MRDLSKAKICVIGLGYVGLPLSILLSKKYEVIGYDNDRRRIEELKSNYDHTGEVSDHELSHANKLRLSSVGEDIKDANVYIVTVPTPVDRQNLPDLKPLENVCKLIGGLLTVSDLVIFESTVFPGATEDICVPILEKTSGLRYNEDFYCGYSPERINPGDKINKIQNIAKITAGSTPEVAAFVDSLYSSVITAGTFQTQSIRVAEAAKVIENTQRDLNIALVNEFAQLFDVLSIDTKEVLDAAATKWNFMSFTPGLVGGHCIGVDPYYLTYKAQMSGYQPELILTARRLNDRMGKFVATKLIKNMVKRGIEIVGSKILIMGLTFKENCSDIRNTKVQDIYNEINEYTDHIDLHDPIANETEVKTIFGQPTTKELKKNVYDAIIVAVAHKQFKDQGLEKIKSFGNSKCLIFDVKSILESDEMIIRL